MDYSLTDDQKLLKQTFKKFATNELTREYVAWIDDNVNFVPDEIWNKLSDMGFFGIEIPEEYGGSGMTYTDYIIALEEIATGSVAVAIGSCTSATFGSRFVQGMGTEEQKKFHLPKIADGSAKYCMALTEPGGGTDILRAMRTTAVKKGDKYVINGQKVFITGAHVADYICVVCITDPNQPKKTRAISCFMVDAKSPGITINLIKKLSIHGCGTTEIFFDNVEVPEENLMGELNEGWKKLIDVLNPERITCAMLSLGVAKAAYAYAHEYSLQRQAFGKPLGQFQILQHYFADMMVEIENATNIIYKCCWLLETGQPYHKEAAMAKLVAGKASEIAAIKGSQIMGGYGVCMEYEMQRHYRDHRQMMFSPITDEMAKNNLAQWSGLPRSF